MRSLTLYPQGLYAQNKPFNPQLFKAFPTTIDLEGFPLEIQIKSLKGLSFWQRRQASKWHAHHHGREQDWLFYTHTSMDMAIVHVTKIQIQPTLDLLTAQGFPVAGLRLQILDDARHFSQATLHLKTLPTGIVRLMYVQQQIPYLVRYVPKNQQAAEIKATLAYIRQTYHDQVVKISEIVCKPVVSFIPRYSPWHNSLWPRFFWSWFVTIVSLGLVIGSGCAGLYCWQQIKIIERKTQDISQTLTKLHGKISGLPYKSTAKTYEMIKKVYETAEKTKPSHISTLIQPLGTILQGVTLEDLTWTPGKQLKLLVTFKTWKDYERFQDKLTNLWQGSQVKHLAYSETSEGMMVQWHIHF